MQVIERVGSSSHTSAHMSRVALQQSLAYAKIHAEVGCSGQYQICCTTVKCAVHWASPDTREVVVLADHTAPKAQAGRGHGDAQITGSVACKSETKSLEVLQLLGAGSNVLLLILWHAHHDIQQLLRGFPY